MINNSYYIGLLLRSYYGFQEYLLINNGFVWGGFESDFIRVTNSHYMHEYEIKVSMADFKKDFHKGCKEARVYSREEKRMLTKNTNKHFQIENGQSKLATFSFVVPEGLVDEKYIPQYCGLYYVTKEYTRIKEIKKPRRLKGAEKVTDKKLNYLFRKTYFHHHNNMMQDLRELELSYKKKRDRIE